MILKSFLIILIAVLIYVVNEHMVDIERFAVKHAGEAGTSKFRPSSLLLLLRSNFIAFCSVLASLFSIKLFDAERSLLRATEDGDERTVRLLIGLNASIDAFDDKGHNVLLVAAHRGQTEIVRWLLTKRTPSVARVNAASGEARNTALHESANAGQSKTTQLLLELGADVNVRNNLDNTPLHFAAAAGSERDTQLLLNAGADATALNRGDETPLTSANGKALELFYKKYYPLHYAAKFNQVEKASELVEKKPALVSARDHNQATPLHWAVLNGFGDVADVLIEAGAKLNLQDKNGDTPLVTLLCRRSIR